MTKQEFSAGGVVYRVIPARPFEKGSPFAGKAGIQSRHSELDSESHEIPDQVRDDKDKSETIEILVSQHSGHHGWVFPKGFIGDKEEFKGQTKEQTALREVEEETGAIGEIIEPLTPISYWYQMNGEKHHKTVYYYIMKFVGGDITKHDWEMENVEWLEEDKVADRLTYPSDKNVWIEAQKRIKELVKELYSSSE